MKNHYQTLGVDDFSDLATVKKAFRHFVKDLHYDKFEYGSAEAKRADEELKKYTQAYSAIKTQPLKDKYDRELALYLKRHRPAAAEVNETKGAGKGAKAWEGAKPDAKPKPEETTAEPKAEADKPVSAKDPKPEASRPEPDPLDPKAMMTKRQLDEAYSQLDEDPPPTVDVRL